MDMPLRTCKKCAKEFPITLEYFYKTGNTLSLTCKKCYIERTTQAQKARSKEQKAGYTRRFNEKHHERLQERNRIARAENPEYYREIQRRYRERNREKLREIQRNGKRKARKNNPHKIREYDRVYRKTPKARVTDNIGEHRKRARKRNLPSDFTRSDWQYCLDYWNHRCCICGRPIGLWHTIAKEHWIPLADKRPDNPGTTPSNILPMCHSTKDGEGGCNNSKSDHDARTWLIEYVGKTRATRIIKKINEFFSTVRK